MTTKVAPKQQPSRPRLWLHTTSLTPVLAACGSVLRILLSLGVYLRTLLRNSLLHLCLARSSVHWLGRAKGVVMGVFLLLHV